MSTKKCNFKQTWTKESIFSWVKPAPNDNFSARCSICNSTFSLSNMGRRALISHMNGKKHKEIAKNKALASFSISTNNNVTEIGSTDSMHNSNILPTVTNTPSRLIDSTRTLRESLRISNDENCPSKICSSTCAIHCNTTISKDIQRAPESQRIKHFIVNDRTTEAEILWCLHAVMYHNSLRNIASGISLIKAIFSDSEVAKKMQLSKTKAAYMITYGITNYFQSELKQQIKKCNNVVILFDESLNKVCQKEQMDIFVRFWDEEKNETVTRYWTSTFLGHTTAFDLLVAFKSSIPQDMLQKVLQISMDGPNVNFKFLKELKHNLMEDFDNKKILDLGSCGLHTLHCAFKGGIKITKWEIIEFLRSLHNLFKNVPARKADFIKASSSQQFPMKFCAIRWLENASVAERACTILPNIRKYVEKMTKEKKIPQCASFKIVANALNDKMLLPKLTFFQSLANDVQLFLTNFQSDYPMTPFLYDELIVLLRNMMEKIVKPDILREIDLLKIDIKKEDNLFTTKYVNLGYAIESALRQVKRSTLENKVSDLEIMKFKEQSRKCIQAFIAKIMDRSPLKFPIIKAVSCLNPAVALQTDLANKRLSTTLHIFIENEIISGNTGDKIDREYKRICAIPAVQEKLKSFNRSENRVDHYWVDLIMTFGISEYNHLLYFVKIVMILLHGNATVERGFSVNKGCLVENLHEKSLIAQRTIYDAITVKGGLENFVITKDLIYAARNSHSRYKEDMAKQKKEKKEEEEAREKQKRAVKIIKELEEKKKKLLDEAVKETAQIDEKIKEIKKL